MSVFRLSPATAFVIILWCVFIVDAVVPGLEFWRLGIRPRRLDGLLGILASPFVHADLNHLVANSLPLLVLPAVAGIGLSNRAILTVMIMGGLGAGIGTWIFGTSGVVIGASGIVFALMGFLVALAFYKPNLHNILICGLCAVLYGGAIISLFSIDHLLQQPFVSWAAHFWGFVSGVVIARSSRKV